MGKNAHLSSVKCLIVSVLLITPISPIRRSAVLDMFYFLGDKGRNEFVI